MKKHELEEAIEVLRDMKYGSSVKQEKVLKWTIKKFKECLEKMQSHEDVISREMVIDTLRNKAPDQEGVDDLIAIIKDVPPVTPQPKTGCWIETDGNDSCWYMCSECHRRVDDISDYYPNCGAKMSEIPTGCSNLDSCENCKYNDGDCCRLIYEAKMVEPQESEVTDADSN